MDEKNSMELIDLEEEERARKQRELRRAKAREERHRKQEMRRLRKKIFGRLCMIIVVFGAAFLYCYIFRYPHQKIEDNVITRDLGRGPEFITRIFTDERDLAWDSELPNFVKKDFKLAEEKGYSIEYTFGAHTIIGRVEDGKPYIILESPFDTYLSFSFYEKKENFSMYYSAEDEGLVLYAYPVSMSHQFEKVILYSDPSEYPYSTTVTYDTNLPLEMVDESLNSVKYEDFSLYFNAEDSTFYFYKDGDVVSSRKFHDKLKTLYRYYGFIETENKLIYKIYVYEKDGIPDIQFVYVASDMSFVKSKYGYSCQSLSGRDLNLPILQSKDSDRLYTIVPKDWDVYELYGSKPAINEYQPGCNYNFDLITLEDKFSYAEFDYYGSWDVELNFAIDGSLFAIEFDVDGYDSSFSLTDAEKEELSIRVYSFKEIWAHIEKIRETYHSHYTSSLSEMLQKKY